MIMNVKKSLLCLPLALGLSGWGPGADAATAQRPLIAFAAAPLQVAFPVKDSILTFFYAGAEKQREIEIHVLTPGQEGYGTGYVGTIENRGSVPVIESTFLFNVDSDPEHELFVLARWDGNGTSGKHKGASYKTYVFDQPSAGSKTGSLRLREVEEKISTGPQDPDAIRSLLKTLGY
jgi:hypothetical protein